jgi:undecaprenyl-diphosphatase
VIDWLLYIDTQLFLLINSLNIPALNPVMVFLSGQVIWVPLIIFVIYFSYQKVSKPAFYVFLLLLVLSFIASDVTASYMFKNLFQRLRPCRMAELKPLIINFGQKCGGRFGFVSSHAANSFTLLSYFFLAARPGKKILCLIWLLPLLVSHSRIYLGVHFPGDIIGGAIIGITWGAYFAWIFRNSAYGASRCNDH